MKEEQKRGQLTDRIKEKSIELFGYEMSQNELRLLPYIKYTVTNTRRIVPEHLTSEDVIFLSKYVEKGFITSGVSNCGRPAMSKGVYLSITKDFWDKIGDIIYLGYADISPINP